MQAMHAPRHDDRRRNWGRRLAVGAALLVIALPSSRAGLMPPVLWGIDEDDAELFRIDDYRDAAATFQSFGRLQYRIGSHTYLLGHEVEAMTIDRGQTAYLSLNRSLHGARGPLLLKLDLNQVAPGAAPVADIVGQIALPAGLRGRDVTGLAIHPVTGQLYALARDHSSRRPDRLLMIDKTTGGLLADIGPIIGLGEMVSRGEDIAFDERGRLFVSDDRDDHTYRVDPSTGQIVAVTNSDAGAGVRGSVKFEALAWDFVHDRMIAFDDHGNRLSELSISGSGAFSIARLSTLGITDVEGMAFVPEPISLVLLGAGIIGLAAGRSRD